MKKIMFNDKYGLTEAVLAGRKTMTRRIIPQSVVDYYTYETEEPTIIDEARFEVGEIVAVSQSYETLANSGCLDNMMETTSTFKREYCGAGWSNKMFVRADLMPHQICITDVKVGRLQNITDRDCIREGIYIPNVYQKPWRYTYRGAKKDFATPLEAFADLIDKVSSKGTWKKNQFCFCYEFELIK